MLAEIEMLKTEQASLRESKDNLVILNNQLNERLKTMEKKKEVLTKGFYFLINVSFLFDSMRVLFVD